LRETAIGNTGSLYIALRTRLDEIGLDVGSLKQLIPRLVDMNAVYRIPAAHRDLVPYRYWQDAWSLILNGNEALLPTLVVLLYSNQR
jgi:hypothetical protein